MLRTYNFFLSSHSMLHQHVLDFFNRIEYETGDFDNSFFGNDFFDIVNRHPKILKARLIAIYKQFQGLEQKVRSRLCEHIHQSNNIEGICNGTFMPLRIDNRSQGILKDLRVFFMDLYIQVLDGEGFRDKYGTSLRTHFNGFSRLNESITKCPFCGIGELKKEEDDTRDQYDHFLPKALYPLSAVNFLNLVPSCKECNSFDVKGEGDTISISSGKLFFPYKVNHSAILIEFHIANDDNDLRNIDWHIDYSNSNHENYEIISWRNIYKIDSRYQGFVKARIQKWHRHYWLTVNGKAYAKISDEFRDEVYFEFLKNDEEVELDFIRLPSLAGFLSGSPLAQAQLQAKMYS